MPLYLFFIIVSYVKISYILYFLSSYILFDVATDVFIYYIFFGIGINFGASVLRAPSQTEHMRTVLPN